MYLTIRSTTTRKLSSRWAGYTQRPTSLGFDYSSLNSSLTSLRLLSLSCLVYASLSWGGRSILRAARCSMDFTEKPARSTALILHCRHIILPTTRQSSSKRWSRHEGSSSTVTWQIFSTGSSVVSAAASNAVVSRLNVSELA